MNVGSFVMQACTQPGQDYLTDFKFIQAFVCTYTADVGFLVAGLIVWATISLAIYTKQGSPIIPLVLLFQFGGVVVAQIAGVATAVVVLLVLTVPAGIAALLYFRYSL